MHHDPLSAPCACTALRKASRAVTRLYDEVMAGTGLSIAQFAVLRNIARSEPLALARLAERLVMDRTTLYRALAPLERRGWIAIDSDGGRAKAARLTAAGHEAMAAAEPAWAEAQARLLAPLGGAWDELAGMLTRLTALAAEAH